MSNCFRILVSLLSLCFCLPGLGQDSISHSNQKKIEELRARIDKLYSIEENPDSLIFSLKEMIRLQRDSIKTLTTTMEVARITNSNLNPCNCSWVYYDLGKDRTDYSIYPELDSLASQLKRDSSLRLKLIGHADKTGSEELNHKLSLQRSRDLKQYLIKTYKLKPEKIITEGRGSKEHIHNITDPKLYHLNRRVEMYLEKL